MQLKLGSCVVMMATVLTGWLGPADRASADCTTGAKVGQSAWAVVGEATRSCSTDGNGQRPASRPTKPGPTARDEYEKQVKAIIARNAAKVSAYNRCFERSPNSAVCAQPTLDEIPAFAEGTGKPLGPSMPPQLVAYTAAARLKLIPPKPVIGPPPSINPWKIAAVGYPLWLSTDADLNPPAVSDSVEGLSVRVRARLSQVRFSMGDGRHVTCTDLSRKWTRQVIPGTPSPTCGYRYDRVPRTGKTYTITAQARWTVTVTINGTQYPVTLAQRSSTTLPVGELQVVIR